MPDEGGRVVLVHSSMLFRSSMTDLLPGQHVPGRRENHICRSAPDFRRGSGIAKGGGIPADRRPRRLLNWTAGAADTPPEGFGGSMH